MSDARIEDFLKRLPSGVSDKHRETIATAFGLVENFRSKAAAINADVELSPHGKSQAIKRLLAKGSIEHLNQLREFAAGELADAKAQRASLYARFYPQPDKADAIGEMRGQEIRSYLRSLSKPDLLRLLNETRDVAVISAIRNAPALLSGVSDDARDALLERNIRGEYGDYLDGLGEVESAVTEVTTALSVVAGDLRRLSGLDDREFSKLAGEK